LFTLNFSRYPSYPKLDTSDFDVFIAQTPYPARVSRETALIVRYHDAIPIFMPHTIDNKRKHQAHHFYSLMGNVRARAYFACVSETSRRALLEVFPEAGERAITIHNMLSAHYFYEDSRMERVPQIVRNRLDRRWEITSPKFLTLRESDIFYRRTLDSKPLRYLLVVSKVEPRKNHLRLLAAWETIRAECDPDVKLIVVGGLGWDYDITMRAFRSAIDQGTAFFLSEVPAADLRVLYRHALITVCPSLAEGFDYSGVEAMRCGGLVVASDIPVHREIYHDAAEYFDPYSTSSLVNALAKLLSAGASSSNSHLRERGSEVAAQYLPELIVPQWEAFLQRVVQERTQ
jgi:glycosyltransferase involved in cell wall biosynthesis